LGSCQGASGYDEIINFPDSIIYITNEITVNNFGVVRASFTISVSSSTISGTYNTDVIYIIYRSGNECRSRTLLFKINVVPPKVPVADFVASPTSIVEGGTVQFTDLSLNPITNWFWDFGDGNNSTDVNPSHSYPIAGNYTVSLTVTGPAGSNLESKENYIEVLPQGTPGAQLWNFETDWGAISTPTIDQTGTVYIGSRENYLYAINPDGTEKWRHLAGDLISSSVAGNDGTIYFSSKHSLAAVDTEGNRLWTYPIFGDVWDLAIGVDGIIYIITTRSDHTLQAINTQGEMIWSLSMGWLSAIPMRVSIAPDGTIYGVEFLMDSNIYRLYAITPEGIIKWTREAPASLDYRTKIAIDSDGTIYIGGYARLYAVYPDGSEKWTYSGIGGNFKFEPTIDRNGNIYVVYDKISRQYIMSFDNNGNLNWSYEVPDGTYPFDAVISSVTIGADDMLYFTVRDSNLYALNPDGTLSWKFKFEDSGDILPGFESAPTISEDKTLLVGFGDRLYAVTTTSSGLADSPWPKAGQNQMNTGRKIKPAPYLISPKKDSIQVPLTTQLKWSSIAGATEYELEMDTNEDFSGSFVYRAQVTEDSLLIENLQYSTTYYWHVRVHGVEGISKWPPTWNFTTLLPLPIRPTLLSPENGDSLSTSTISLAWEKLPYASSYQSLVAEDSLFSKILMDTTVSDTTLTISSLEIGKTYLWKIRGINISGGGEWSDTWKFTTYLEHPEQPTLHSPTNGDSLFTTTCSLVWGKLSHTTNYQLQLAFNSSFSQIHTDTTILDTVLTIYDLDSGLEYFWRVRGKNITADGPWSITRSFMIVPVTGMQATANVLPESYRLLHNYPNPFNPITRINFKLPNASHVVMKIYDIFGREVRTLVEKQYEAGRYYLTWDARDDYGDFVSSGIYIYEIKAGKFSQAKKMTLIK
jgi:PKD repeat protein